MKPLRRFLHAHNLRRLNRALARLPHIRMLRRHHPRQVGAIHLANRPRLRHQLRRISFQSRNDAAHRSVIAQMPHQRPRINLAQHRNFMMFEIFFRHLLRTPIRAHARELPHDQALNIRTRRFAVFSVGAVVSNLRICENDNLPGIGRVSENFLISGQGSIKNDFAVAFALCAVAFASEDAAIFEGKDCLHSCSREWI